MKLPTPSAPAMKAASDLFTVTTEDPAHAGILQEVFIETFARKIDSAFEEERASLAELRAIVAEFLMTHALEPTRTRPVMPMNTPLAKALLQRARAAVGLTDTDLTIHPEELNHTQAMVQAFGEHGQG